MKRKFKVLYTHQKTKKRKVWQDGYLTLTVDETRGFLSDEDKKQLSTVYLNKKEVSNGVDLESDKYFIQVEEEVHKDASSSNESTQNNLNIPDQAKESLIPPIVCSKVRSKFTVPKKATPVQAAQPPNIDMFDTDHDQVAIPTVGSIWSSISGGDTSHLLPRAKSSQLMTATKVKTLTSMRETSQLLELLDCESNEHTDTAVSSPNKENSKPRGKVADLVVDFPSFLEDGASTLDEEPLKQNARSKLQLRLSQVQGEAITLGTLGNDRLSQDDVYQNEMPIDIASTLDRTLQNHHTSSQNNSSTSRSPTNSVARVCFSSRDVKQCLEDLIVTVTLLVGNSHPSFKPSCVSPRTLTEQSGRIHHLPLEMKGSPENGQLSFLLRHKASLPLCALSSQISSGAASQGNSKVSDELNACPVLVKKPHSPEVVDKQGVCPTLGKAQCDDDGGNKGEVDMASQHVRDESLMLEDSLVGASTVSQCPVIDEARPAKHCPGDSTDNDVAACNNNKPDVEFESKFIGLDEDCDVRIEMDLFDSLYEAYDVNNREGNGFHYSEMNQNQVKPIKKDCAQLEDSFDSAADSGTSDFCGPNFDVGLSQFDASPVLSLKDKSFLDEATNEEQCLSNADVGFILRTRKQESYKVAGMLQASGRDGFYVHSDLENSSLCEKKDSLEFNSRRLNGEVGQEDIGGSKSFLSKLNDRISYPFREICDTGDVIPSHLDTKGRSDLKLIRVNSVESFQTNRVEQESDSSIGRRARGNPDAGKSSEAVGVMKSTNCKLQSISQDQATNTVDTFSFSPMRSSQLSNDDSVSVISALKESQQSIFALGFMKNEDSDQKVPTLFDDFNSDNMDDELLLQACLEIDVQSPLKEKTKSSANHNIKSRNSIDHSEAEKNGNALVCSEVANEIAKKKLNIDQIARPCLDTLHNNFPIVDHDRKSSNISDAHINIKAAGFPKNSSVISNITPVSACTAFSLAEFYKENPPKSLISSNCTETMMHDDALLTSSDRQSRAMASNPLPKSFSNDFIDAVAVDSGGNGSFDDWYSQSRSGVKKNVNSKPAPTSTRSFEWSPGCLSLGCEEPKLPLPTTFNIDALNIKTINPIVNSGRPQQHLDTLASQLKGSSDFARFSKKDSDRAAIEKVGGIFSKSAAEDNYLNSSVFPIEFFKGGGFNPESEDCFRPTFCDEFRAPSFSTTPRINKQLRERGGLKKQKLEMKKMDGYSTAAESQSIWARFMNENREIRKIEVSLLGERLVDSFDPNCFTPPNFVTSEPFTNSDNPLLPFHFGSSTGWSPEKSCTSLPFGFCALNSLEENSTFSQTFRDSFSDAQQLDELLNPQRRVLRHSEFATSDDVVDEGASKWERFRDDDQYVPRSTKMRERWVKKVIKNEMSRMHESFYSPVRRNTLSKEESLLQTPGFSLHQQEASQTYVFNDHLWDKDL